MMMEFPLRPKILIVEEGEREREMEMRIGERERERGRGAFKRFEMGGDCNGNMTVVRANWEFVSKKN